MTAFVPESIRILGTDGGGLSVVLCSMYVDTLADLPTPTAYTGFRLSMGCTARVINDNSRHLLNSAGQWVDITENDGKYTLPPATSNSLGGIMVGSGLTIDSAGMLSGDFSALWDSIYQTEKHLTGVPPLSFMASGNGIEAAVIYGNGQQTGTPTPDAPIPFIGCGTREVYEVSVTYPSSEYTYMVNNGKLVDAIKQLGAGRYTFSWDFQSNATGTFKDRLRLYVNGVNKLEIANGQTIDFTETLAQEIQRARNFSIQLYYGQGNTDGYFKDFVIDAGYKIPLTCAGQTVPVYLGQTQTVRRIKKLVLTGNEEIRVDPSYNRFYFSIMDMRGEGMRLTKLYCTHYQNISDGRPIDNVPDDSIYSGGGGDQKVFIKTTDYTTVADFKSYLASEYAAGHPVTVWYVLAEPETGIVNEPLAKIGTYADELSSTDAGISIQTVRGQNTLTIGTTLQPSKISITYF